MNEEPSTPPPDKSEEIFALVRRMQETEQRLQELTGGELDVVLFPTGTSFLLRKTQEDLLRSEAVQRRLADTQSSILNALPANIALIDGAGKIISVNDGWRQFAGDNALQGEACGIGQNYLEICEQAQNDHSEEAHKVAAAIRSVLSGAKKNFDMEYPCHSPGKQRWFRLLVAPLHETRASGAVVMHLDITERKRMEAAIRATELRHRSLFDNMLEGYCYCRVLYDENGRAADYIYLEVNDAFAAQTGLKDVAGKKVSEVVPGMHEANPEQLEIYSRVAATGQPEKLETYAKLLDIWFSVSIYSHEKGHFIAVFDNITQRKRAEESLAATSALLETLLENTTDHIYFKDLQSRFVHFSFEMLKLFRLKHPAELKGRTDFDFFTEEHARPAFAVEQEIIRTGRPVLNLEEKTTHLDDGRTEWVLTSKMPWRDKAGNIIGTIGISRDITERKRAGEALRQSEARFRSVFTASATGIATSTPQGRFLQANAAYCRMLGYTEDELRGRDFTSLTHPEDLPLNLKLRDEILAGLRDNFVMEKRYLKKGGDIVWVSHSVSPIRAAGGEVTAFITVAENITERKEAQDAIRLFRTLVDQSNDFIEVIDPDTYRFLDVSENTCISHGYTRKEMLSMSVGDVDPDFSPAVREQIGRELHTASRMILESRHRRKDGTTFPVEVTIKLVQLDKSYMVAIVRDITERKRAEQSLVLFRTLVDQSNDFIEVIDPATNRYLDVNESACTSHGYTRNEMLSMSLGDIDPDFTSATQERIERELQKVGHMTFESRHRRKDGTTFPVEITVKLVRLDKSYTVAIVRDITGRKQVEDALRESEERFSNAFNHAPIGMALTSLEGRWLKVNRALCKLTGFSENELLGRSFQEITHRDDLSADLKSMPQLLAGEIQTYKMEKRYLHKQGNVVHVLLNVSLVRANNGQPRHFVSQILDITEQKRLELRFRRLVDSNAQAVFFWNVKGEITDCNEAFLKLVGYTCEDLKAGRVNWSVMSPPEYAELDQRGLKEVKDTGICQPYEKEFIRKDGSRVPVLIGAAIFQDNPDEGVAFVLDLTERKKIEAQFRQSQKMESIGHLASGVAHDFNNILAVIQIQSDLLKSDNTLSAEQLEFVRTIGRASQSAANLTRQLLLFSRKQAMQLRELDLNETIGNMTKILTRSLGENIEIQFKFAMQALFIHADVGMIDQVLLNLAVNARDAMPKGGRLVIETSAVEFDETTPAHSAQMRHGKFICLAVSDNGTGIAPENLSKIFDPFFTTKEVGKGTGLGLATVFGIIQQHQGWINVYSEVGKGTTFRIYLPRLSKTSEGKIATPTTEYGRGGNETILFVEDEPTLRSSVKTALSRLGYRVLDAINGVEALEIWNAKRDEIQLVLTDMVMPGGINGMQLGERLLKDNPKLKIIYASGYSSEIVDKNFPLKEGVNFLAKPFEMHKLAKTIRDNLDARA
jgi:PAS domain S-box-containing protein